jgi:hypothetical protein
MIVGEHIVDDIQLGALALDSNKENHYGRYLTHPKYDSTYSKLVFKIIIHDLIYFMFF